MNQKHKLNIVITADGRKQTRGAQAWLEKTAALVFKRLPETLLPLAARAEATLLLTSDAQVRRLNRDFRGIDKTTNVLSFPQFTRRELRRMKKGKKPVYIGDIAVACRFAASEARRENKKPECHLRHLLIHGLLHLFGYDHQAPASAARMERLEKTLMAELGLPDPYRLAPPVRRRV